MQRSTPSARRHLQWTLLALSVVASAACAPDVHRGSAGPPSAGVAPLSQRAVHDVAPATQALAGSAVAGLADADVRVELDVAQPPLLDPSRLVHLAARLAKVRSRPLIREHSLSAMGVDLETGQVIFAAEPDRLMKPASNTKMFTTAAALSLLGPDYRFTTDLYVTAEPDKRGVIEGDVIMVGRHDPTWSNHFYRSANVPMDALAEALVARGVKRVKGEVVLYGEYVYDGFRYDTYGADRHRRATARGFRKRLNNAGIHVRKTRVEPTFEAPVTATHVASWSSVPLGEVCVPINTLSHNEFADALLRHVGWKTRGESSYKAGATSVIEWLAAQGVDTTGMALNDGSGLSHDNRVSAKQVVALMQVMLASPVGELWLSGMSVAGVTGTFGGRMRGAETRGRVFAKSGTLDGVVATSGVLQHTHDGRRYAFALLMNDVRSRDGGRRALDALVRSFARDMRGAGARPSAPTLQAVVNQGDGQSVDVRWLPAHGADAYQIWLSRDGATWSREQLIDTDETRRRIRDLATGSRVYVRITASNEAGQSDPSDVYGTVVSHVTSSVLVVDGNDRWDAEPCEENPLGWGHAFVPRITGAITTAGYDAVANEVVAAGQIDLDRYDLVLWSLGEESGETRALGTEEQRALRTYLEDGGKLWVSGSELAYDLTEGSSEDRAFLRDMLKARLVEDDAHTYRAHGKGTIFGGLAAVSFFTPSGMDISVPDRIAPTDGADACLTYDRGAVGAAAIAYKGDYTLLYFGFPFEAIDSGEDRAAVMGRALTFFGLQSEAEAPDSSKTLSLANPVVAEGPAY